VVWKPSAQVAAPQATSLPGQVAQWVVTPSQEAAQGPLPGQAGRPGAGAPLTATQVPLAQDSHWPGQGRSQQTPSTQARLAQSVALVQNAPFA
jgi:hypothetical protein